MANNIDKREIDRVLQSRRKHRESRACYPCRQRKVKCDSTQPCRTCRRRGHPQICVYDIEHSGRWDTSHASPVRQNFESRLPSSQDNLQQQQPDAPASPYVYSGDNSVMSILRHRTHDNGSMAQEVGSVLGLHNTYSSYPFMDTRTTGHRWEELLRIVPQRTEVLRFFQCYRQLSYPFNPILVDIEQFELDLCKYLNAYAAGEFQDTSPASEFWATDRPIGHISLLLAALSAGAHYSDLEHLQRSEICQDLARRSFQALRLANFLFRPSFDIIQTLLVLGNTLQNNGQSDAAWALLGTTVRLAQTLGLHTERSVARLPIYLQSKAKKLWSMIVWQDSLLSFCYDRPPVVSLRGLSVDNDISSGCNLTYIDVMHCLCRLGLEITTADRDTQEITLSLNMLNALDNIYQQGQPHLRFRESCKSMQDNLENLALKMHVSLAASVLSRPAMKQALALDPSYSILRERAKTSLLDASTAFLEFQALSVIPLRTWSMVHTVLSSTLLLCLWEETRNDKESRDLQQRVIEVFSAGSVGNSASASVNGQWLSARHIRALVTLRNAVGTALDREPGRRNFGENPTMPDMFSPLPTFDLSPGLPEGFDQIGVSPISYLDSIMNVPLFDFSQESAFPPVRE